MFMDENGERCVMDRSERVNLLHNFPFAGWIDVCLALLDEAHTRGIDLRLAQTYRASITLGTRLPKDRLIQACMRMRKLGKGRTEVFGILEKVQDRI